jgi:phenylacetate-CoA ligase
MSGNARWLRTTFPFTTKTDLRDNYPFGMFAVPREKMVRVHASSGTTGKPTVVGYTRPTSTPGPT